MDVPVFDKVPGYSLYIGGFISLRRPQALANCRITHILSVLDWHFDNNSQLINGYKHLHIPVDDMDDEDLLVWFPEGNRFIDEGLNYSGPETKQDQADGDSENSGVLVHCAMGKSRSATMILAYLLWDSRRRSRSTPTADPDSDTVPIPPKALDVTSALNILRQGRPLAEPNGGFMKQLELYHAMGCPDNVESEPKYQHWLYDQKVQESVMLNRAPEVSDVRFEDEHLRDGEGDLTTTDLKEGTEKERDQEIKCRKCRRLLAKGNFLADHEPPQGKSKKDCAHIFLHPLSWMKSALSEEQLDGRLTCPNSKCGANIGKFAWQGTKCSCGGWVTPAFTLIKGKVDETIVTTRRTGAAVTVNNAPGGGAVRPLPGMKRSGNL